MKSLSYFMLLIIVFVTSCKNEVTPAIPDAGLVKLQSTTYTDVTFGANAVITGHYYPFISVKLDAANHYQIIRNYSTDRIFPTLDTLTGTYSYNAITEAVKFNGDKLKLVTRPRTNVPEKIYFADWKIKSLSGDTLKVDLDYSSLPTESGMEFYKVLVKK